ncbi:MAG: 4Fe-4S binding protein [Oscillospiraceae bacterium]|nr:4Fe-4S binding protein [Oscillospiraceae bacterium]
MINVIDKKKCAGCTACYSVCPTKCIRMVADEEGFLYPIVDESKCVNCKLCEGACPILNRSSLNEDVDLAYAFINKDESVRKESSSGGAFYALARIVIASGGVVYGASLSPKLQVEHIRISSVEQLGRLQGSKYVQSALGNIFNQVKEDLAGGPCYSPEPLVKSQG